MNELPDFSRLTSDEKDAVLGAFWEQIEALRIEIAELRAENAELKRRLNQNSGNSSKPPSSDGLKKPRVPVTLREKTGKKSGGQEGHKGSTLRQTPTPDKTVDLFPTCCATCAGALNPKTSTGYDKRQVVDIPDPHPLETTEFRAHTCGCEHCGAVTQAAFPNGVNAPVQYGNRIASLIVYLQIQHHIPEDRIVEIVKSLYGIELATDTVATMRKARAERFKAFAEAVGELVKKVPVKNMDETGFRVAGTLWWLHVAATGLLTHYRVNAKRGAMLAGVVGIIVHDFFRSYFTMPGLVHALCNAHLLRELKMLMENEKEPWAFSMFRFLRQVCHAINVAKRLGVPLDAGFIAYIEARYDRILAKATAWHEHLPPLEKPPPEGEGKRRRGRKRNRIGYNLLARLRDHKNDVLRCVKNPDVPFSNNQAEQDVRMMKVHQKVSGCFRTAMGAENFAILRTVISTARKQGWDILQTLASTDPVALVQNLRAA
jgi:transposase